MKLHRVITALALAALATGAFAQTSASAVITEIGQVGSTYTYDIDLTNTGTTGIETFWFAWVPGANFMPDDPSAITQPAGWTGNVTSGGGYAIQWKSATGLATGSSLDGFQFSSVDSLATLEGNSGSHPILTSFVYSGQPLSGTSDQFLVTPAPEPAGWISLGALAIAALVVRRRTLATSS